MGAVNIEYTADCWQVGDYHSIISPYIRLNQIDNTAPLNCSQQCIDPWHLHITFNWHSHDGYRFFRIRISLFFQNEYINIKNIQNEAQTKDTCGGRPKFRVKLMITLPLFFLNFLSGKMYVIMNAILCCRKADEGSRLHFRNLICCEEWSSIHKKVDPKEAYITFLWLLNACYDVSLEHIRANRNCKCIRKTLIDHTLHKRIKEENKICYDFVKTLNLMLFNTFKK